MVMANRPDIVVIDKAVGHKKAVVVDVAILSDSNIWKMEHEKCVKFM